MITTDGGDSGVYLNAHRVNGKPLGEVDFGFDYDGTYGGGSPRFSIPVDENGDGGVEYYAFVDANSCGGGAQGTASTELASCKVYYGHDPVYANWDAFAQAHQTWTVAKDDTAFAIADSPSDVTLGNVAFWVNKG